MPPRGRLGVLGLALLLGCARRGAPALEVRAAGLGSRWVVAGQVALGGKGASGYRTQATMGDIALAATVSLIDPTADQTVATALTNAAGDFLLSPSTLPTAGTTYYLEAVKGLDNNAVGSDAARVRTLIEFASGSWQSITVGQIVIDPTTTALCVIASLNPGTITPSNLLGTLLADGNSVKPDTFAPSGTGITQSNLTQVFGLVNQIIASDFDPFDGIISNGSSYVEKSTLGLALDRIVPDPAAVGSAVTIWGTGLGSGDTVSFAGGASAPIVSSSANDLQVVVPAGAQSGNVAVTVGASSASVPFTVLPAVTGGVSS